MRQALKDRPWLMQVDFLMAGPLENREADAFRWWMPGSRSCFLLTSCRTPEACGIQLLIGLQVPQLVFEQQVLSAHDRSFEEQRFAPMLWDTLFERAWN